MGNDAETTGGSLVGIDAGSKTIKVVVLDEEGALRYSVYRRHRANIRETTLEILHDLVWRYGDIEGTVAVTGSAGIELSEMLGLPFVQEVVATTHMVQTAIPDADALIELGGEDAKIVYLSGGLEQRMNASCAGGTGGFIDTIAFMLGIRTQAISSLAMGSSRIYPIASRCAVFAQTDVRPLLYSGAKKADIAASALEAVVKQTISGLACGRPVSGKAVFLGGPLEHIPDLVIRFRRALGLTHKTGIKPHDAHLFTAMGTALLGPRLLGQREGPRCFSLADLEGRLAEAPPVQNQLPTLPPLFSDDAERAAFKERHRAHTTPRKPLSECEGPLYLGIDAGSTTVKLAVVDGDETLVYSDYQPTQGDALKATGEMLGRLYRALPHVHTGHSFAWIAHATATGYGEDLLQAAFGIDSGMVETVAHLRAARHLYPATDFILDIGGQDMKALWIRDGRIANAVLNEACSSGCGSFIEGTAYSLRLSPYTFADLALCATAPIDLGMKCTVFMTSRVRHAQKIGIPYADIAAGLAYSVVKNALFKIIGMNNIDELGKNVVVQGGAFMSDAVLRAFELISGVSVIRPDIAHIMGAYGAALTAAARAREGDAAAAGAAAGGGTAAGCGAVSTLVGPEGLAALKPVKRVQRCPGCTNACLLAVMEFEGGAGAEAAGGAEVAEAAGTGAGGAAGAGRRRRSVSGNRCPRAFSFLEPGGRGTDRGRPGRPPNLYGLEQKLLARYARQTAPAKGANAEVYVGIPPALNLYESLPFWHTLLTRLGLSVVLPASARREGPGGYAGAPARERVPGPPVASAYGSGLETVPSESVCFPAKTVHLQVAELIAADVDAVFMPLFARGSRCPVSSGYASVLAGNIPPIASGEVALVSPVLNAVRPEKIGRSAHDKAALLAALGGLPGLKAPWSDEAFEGAFAEALEEQSRFQATLNRARTHAFTWMKAQGRRGIVLAGRPYHVDAALCHGIDTLLVELGFAVLSPTVLRPLGGKGAAGGLPGSDWRPALPLTRLADFVGIRPDLDLVCLYSFGCGFDALSLEPARAALEAAGKAFTAFKVDDIVDLAHIRIRLRTLAETIEEHSRDAARPEPCDRPCDKGPYKVSRVTPYTAPCHTAHPETLRLGELQPEDVERARASVNHDICFTVSSLAGGAINLLERNPSATCLRVPRVCQGCLLDGLPGLIKSALGWAPEIIWEDEWAGQGSDNGTQGPEGPQRQEGRPARPQADSATRPQRRGEPQGEGPQGPKGSQGQDRPRIGILGNALLCFDGHANHHVRDLIAELGCEAVFPPEQALFTDDVRYINQIEAFSAQGIHDIVYLQAFGCLKGHIESRGALRDLQKRFPSLRLTIVDFDHDISALNQENRIRLALAAAGV